MVLHLSGRDGACRLPRNVQPALPPRAQQERERQQVHQQQQQQGKARSVLWHVRQEQQGTLSRRFLHKLRASVQVSSQLSIVPPSDSLASAGSCELHSVILVLWFANLYKLSLAGRYW